jgi:hypothetical protein
LKFNRNALAITLRELNDITVAARIGESNIPNTGNKTPAAIGMQLALYIEIEKSSQLMYNNNQSDSHNLSDIQINFSSCISDQILTCTIS